MTFEEFLAQTRLLQFGPSILLVGTFVMTLAAWWCHCFRYPSFREWNEEHFCQKHARHTFSISLVVVPGMLLQIAGSLLLLAESVPFALKVANLICLGGSIFPTLLVSAPIHGRLSRGRNEDLIERLISTNLPRTVFWTAHFFVAIVWMVSRLS